jgi:4-hydroxythreonine-4-phosphate dehydrogenase
LPDVNHVSGRFAKVMHEPGRPLALTMGDPAGIGGEIALKAWRARRNGRPFVLLDDPARFDGPVRVIAHPAEAAAIFPHALPVIPIPLAVPSRPGHPDVANAPAVIASIERATALALAGEVAAVVTNPISKATLYGAGFAHPGHTEFLAALTGAPRPVMMLASPMLRVVPVTIHVSLRRAIELLTVTEIVETVRITAAGLRRDFGIAAPRIALSGLNPHAGEQGALGEEEQTIIAPAMEILRGEGIAVTGPWPADTMFTPEARATYDVAVCMYHDQALIPIKTLDMTHGVNVTLGLPIIRTSPDHGTAFGIAGQNRADPSSLIAALDLADQLAATREHAR